jgi:hypothetical protein
MCLIVAYRSECLNGCGPVSSDVVQRTEFIQTPLNDPENHGKSCVAQEREARLSQALNPRGAI